MKKNKGKKKKSRKFPKPKPQFSVGTVTVTDGRNNVREYLALAALGKRAFMAVVKGGRVFDVFRWGESVTADGRNIGWSWGIVNRRNPLMHVPVTLEFDNNPPPADKKRIKALRKRNAYEDAGTEPKRPTRSAEPVAGETA